VRRAWVEQRLAAMSLGPAKDAVAPAPAADASAAPAK
jgi:hypothetical protein